MSGQNIENYLRAKRLYEIICNHELGDDSSGVQQRVDIIGELESITGKQFRNSAEFHQEVQAYIDNRGARIGPLGTRLRKARKRAGLTIKELATSLGFRSHSAFILYEQGKRLPPKEVIEWLQAEEKKGPKNAPSGQNVSAPLSSPDE